SLTRRENHGASYRRFHPRPKSGPIVGHRLRGEETESLSSRAPRGARRRVMRERSQAVVIATGDRQRITIIVWSLRIAGWEGCHRDRRGLPAGHNDRARTIPAAFDTLRCWGDDAHYRSRRRPSGLSDAGPIAPASRNASPMTANSRNGGIRFIDSNRSH